MTIPKKIKKWINLLAIFLSCISLSFFSKINDVLAAGVGETEGIPLDNPLGSGTTFISIINSVINWLIVISIPILALMILIGGFQILTARGEPEKIKSGRTTIWYAVIGFLVILISKGIALIILEIIG